MNRPSTKGLLALLLVAGLFGAAWSGEEGDSASRPSAVPLDDTLSTYTETIPGALVEFEMVPVPAGSVTIEGPDGSRRRTVGPFWMSAVEVRWDAYDTYRLDVDMEGLDDAAADAISLPSKPYGFGNKIPGFGKKGYPALAISRNAAQQYARWLSAKTGHTYRLPTPAEWKHACRVGHGNPQEWSEAQRRERAWYRANADEGAHPVGALEPSDLGVYDQLGNAAEHVVPPGETERPPEVWGGSYRSEAGAVHCTARQQKTPKWQRSDPQLPKSRWWLSDAPFVGFRLVRMPGPAAP